MRHSSIFATLLLVAPLTGCAEPRSPNAPMASADATVMLSEPDAPIGFRLSLVADHYFWLRAKALEGDAPAPFVEELAVMKDLRDDLGSETDAWEDIEVFVGNARSASELAAVLAILPERKTVGGRVVRLREKVVSLARAMEKAEVVFRDGPYREHRDALDRAGATLRARLGPNEAAIRESIRKDLELDDPRPITMTLVFDAPYGGGFAADAQGRTIASFVRIRGLENSALVEATIVEALRALDETSVRLPSAMNTLRVTLGKRGLDDGDANVEMAVQAVLLAEASSLVRRHVDPTYESKATSGFFTFYPAASSVVEAWNRHLAGEPLSSTVDAIAAAVAP